MERSGRLGERGFEERTAASSASIANPGVSPDISMGGYCAGYATRREVRATLAPMLATRIAFCGYVAVALALGWMAYARRDRGAAYWTAGGSLGATSVGLSISAGFLSISWSCVYAVQLFYWYGVGALWLITVPWLLALGGIYLLSQRYHALPSFSQPEMVGRRFGRPAKRIVALALVFVFLVWGGAEIYVAANLLAPGLGVSSAAMILIIAAVVGLYATMGGFRAVVSTDKLQYGVVVLYILTMASPWAFRPPPVAWAAPTARCDSTPTPCSTSARPPRSAT